MSENDKPLYSSRHINIVAALNSCHCPVPIRGPYFTALCLKWNHQYLSTCKRRIRPLFEFTTYYNTHKPLLAQYIINAYGRKEKYKLCGCTSKFPYGLIHTFCSLMCLCCTETKTNRNRLTY